MWEISLFWDKMIIVYRKAHFWTTFYIDIIQPNLSSFCKLYNVGYIFFWDEMYTEKPTVYIQEYNSFDNILL